MTTLRHSRLSASNSPHVTGLCITEDTGGLLGGHPLGYLAVEVGVQLLPLHALELVFGVEFLNHNM